MMSTLTNEQIAVFTAVLADLTRKHCIVIFGCGCCGSPSLGSISEAELEGASYGYSPGDGLEWGTPEQLKKLVFCYDCQRYKCECVLYEF